MFPFRIALICFIVKVASLMQTDTIQKRAATTNDFAMQLMQSIAKSDESVFFSPFSISAALAMVFAGASGTTKTQMQSVAFGGFAKDEELFAKFSNIFQKMQKANNADLQLKSANRIYVEKNFKLQPAFIGTITKYFNGNFENADFIKKTEAERKKINDFVAKETNNKIQNLIATLDPMTKMVLVNAIYFRGKWQSEFYEHENAQEDFQMSASKKKKVAMMHKTTFFQYTSDSEMQMLELSYLADTTFTVQNPDKVSMLIILPKIRFGLTGLEKTLTLAKISQLRAKMTEKYIKLSLPKFRIEQSFELKDALVALGMKDAFDTKADFSKMVGNDKILLSRVVHKAFVSVDEKGTEAAAATAIMAVGFSAMQGPPPIEFKADQPFLFAIVFNEEILFLGRFAGPSA